MTDAEDREIALEQLVVLAQPEVEPTLDSDELEEILDRNKRASRWLASTVLSYGDVILPATRNGQVYRVIAAGTTGTTEPTWPTESESSLIDNSVTFQEAGADYDSVYNLRTATQEAWALKAAKASEFHEGNENLIREHCENKARQYASVLIA